MSFFKKIFTCFGGKTEKVAQKESPVESPEEINDENTPVENIEEVEEKKIKLEIKAYDSKSTEKKVSVIAV